MNFQYMTNLKNLSIQNCTGLNQDIDLSTNVNIEQIDASGTTINVITPENSKLTKYELGSPTAIDLTNPTVLTPNGVVVDSYANLDSLIIKNIPGLKSYATFN